MKATLKMRITIVTTLFILVSCWAAANATDSVSGVSQIALKYRHWVLGSSAIDYSNPLIQVRYKEIIKTIELADQKYGKDKNKDGIPDVLFSNSITIPRDTKQLSDLFSKYLFPLSLGYHLRPAEEHGLRNAYYQNEKVRQQILELFNNLNEYGWTEGIDIGVLHMDRYPETGYIGYYSGMSLRCLGYALSVFLNKDLLQESGLLQRELSTLNFISKEIGPAFDTPVLWKQNGFNTDAVRSMFNVRWCYILSLPEDDTCRSGELAYFSKMLNKSLQIADGWADMIKPDFLGYHHQGAYLNAYAPHGYHAASIFVSLLKGTSYQVSRQAIDNLSQAVLQTRIYSNKYDGPRSTAGRFPDNLNAVLRNIPPFAYLAQVESPYQQELQGAFMRLWDEDFDGFRKAYLKNVTCAISYTGSLGELEQSIALASNGMMAEKHPTGFWYYPYGGLGIYRQDDWLVSFSGCSKYIWDYESSKRGENQFGRFARAGVLRIMAGGDPVSAEASGYVQAGWDWCKLPGATTVDMPFEAMKQEKYKESHRQFTPESYLGGVQIDGNSAVAAIKYVAPVSYDTPLRKLNANKSVFFFDDFIVAVGTNIQAESDTDYPVRTTLFQNGMKDLKTETTINGKKFAKAYSMKLVNEAVCLTDAQGHAYYVPHASQLIIDRKIQSAPDDGNKKRGSGAFTSACLMHGSRPDDESYLYYIKVRGGAQGAKDLSKNVNRYFHIIQQDETAHVVHFVEGQVTGYALLKAHQPTKDDLLLQTDVPCVAMIKERDGNAISLAVQNPELGIIDQPCSYNEIHDHYTHAPSTVQPVQLTLKGEWQLSESADNVAIVRQDAELTIVRFNCLYGKRIQARLHKKDKY